MRDRRFKQAIHYILLNTSQEFCGLTNTHQSYNASSHPHTVFTQMIIENVIDNALITACR